MNRVRVPSSAAAIHWLFNWIRKAKILHPFQIIFVACERLVELAERAHHTDIENKNTFKLIQETEYLAFNNGTGNEEPPTMENGFYQLTRSCSGSLQGDNRKIQEELKATGALDTQSAPVPKRADSSPVMTRRTPLGEGGKVTEEPDVDSIGRPSSRFFLGSDPDLRYRPVRNHVNQNLTTPADQVAAMMAQTEYPLDLAEQVESYKVRGASFLLILKDVRT